MSEEKEVKNTESKETTGDIKDGNKPRETSVLDEANSIYKKLAEQNETFRELLNRQEELMAQQMLRGKSSANVEDKPKEETPKEYKERILANRK